MEKIQPNQPIEIDNYGVERFQTNKIVEFLVRNGKVNFNELAAFPFSDEDRAQFAQLSGYSVSAWSELSYVSDDKYKRAVK